MSLTETQLENLGFTHVSSIKRNKNGHLFFKPKTHEDENTGWIYVWVKVNLATAQFDACYVGKAGKRLKDRWTQQTGGFNGKKGAGKNLARKILDYFDESEENAIYVYAHHSRRCVAFDMTVSMCDVEEHAMYRKLGGKGAGLWNTSIL